MVGKRTVLVSPWATGSWGFFEAWSKASVPRSSPPTSLMGLRSLVRGPSPGGVRSGRTDRIAPAGSQATDGDYRLIIAARICQVIRVLLGASVTVNNDHYDR